MNLRGGAELSRGRLKRMPDASLHQEAAVEVFWHVIWMPSDHFPKEVDLTHPTGRRSQDRSKTHRRNYITHLGREYVRTG